MTGRTATTGPVTAASPAPPSHPGAYERVLNRVGAQIVDGTRPAGSTTTVEALITETGASRSVVREAVRVLGALGTLRAGRRVGITVLPREEWNLLDGRIVGWRLASGDRDAQLRELHDLRLALEPEAAALAAARRDDAEAAELELLGERIVAADGSADFLEADRRFHALILRAARNPMLLRLRSIIDATLSDRAETVSARGIARPHDAALHRELARAIKRHDGAGASTAAREIVDLTAAERHNA